MKTKILILLLFFIWSAANAQVIKGDMDGDGRLTMNDANEVVNTFLGSKATETLPVYGKEKVDTMYAKILAKLELIEARLAALEVNGGGVSDDDNPQYSGSIIGTWFRYETEGSNYCFDKYTFYADGTYILHWQEDKYSGDENGTWSYDSNEQKLTIVANVCEKPGPFTHTVIIEGDKMSFISEKGSVRIFTRQYQQNSIVGSWSNKELRSNVLVEWNLVFDKNDKCIEYGAETYNGIRGSYVLYYTYQMTSETEGIMYEDNRNNDLGHAYKFKVEGNKMNLYCYNEYEKVWNFHTTLTKD